MRYAQPALPTSQGREPFLALIFCASCSKNYHPICTLRVSRATCAYHTAFETACLRCLHQKFSQQNAHCWRTHNQVSHADGSFVHTFKLYSSQQILHPAVHVLPQVPVSVAMRRPPETLNVIWVPKIEKTVQQQLLLLVPYSNAHLLEMKHASTVRHVN